MPDHRARVIIDNDFSGDPDDLYQLVHHLLSPAVTIPLIIGSHLRPGDPGDPSDHQADNAAMVARRVLEVMGRAGTIPVLAGSNVGMSSPTEPLDSPAARAIVAEALRDDTELPLYVALGGGLTELASALLIEPSIAGRLTVVWIGGGEHHSLIDHPVHDAPTEYNMNIDIVAAQSVFNHSTTEIWQVPRDTYEQCVVSRIELDRRVRPMGAIGAHLAEAIDDVIDVFGRSGRSLGTTYTLGDSPLVLLTALQAAFHPDTTSSAHVVMPTPTLNNDGDYEQNPRGRPMRVYTRVDTRLMFEDFFLRLEAFARGDETDG